MRRSGWTSGTGTSLGNWKPTVKTNPQWFAVALKGPASEFVALKDTHRSNYLKKLRNAVHVLILEDDDLHFVPIRWAMARLAGASWSDTSSTEWIKPLNRFDELVAESGLKAIALGDPNFEGLRANFIAACQEAGKGPSAGGRDAEADNRVFYRYYDSDPWSEPGELDEKQSWPEGSTIRRIVDRYERSARAREACLAHHGLDCHVCGTDFLNAYGELGMGFIHVHHKRKLADVPDDYRVDPVHDLVPLCPNCHAMVHRMDDPADVVGLRDIWLSRQGED